MTIVRLSPAVPVAPQNEEPAEYSVERWFARAAASRPGSPALSCGPDAATFAQLDAAASRLAAALAGAGARPGSAVAVLAARSQ
ncbi:MAG TPA: AMP-binding protein, partial [Pyrinomonadaceae bacterium]|nr:AMP-binding protein [Pyrinomonadaceae bacterium]